MTSGQQTSTRARWPRLARRFGPLPTERRGRGELRLIETTVLVLLGILLAVATINDLTRQVHINHRLAADLHTWRQYTGHDYRNLSLEQDVKTYSSRDVVCGNTSPGAPGTHNQVCLMMSGPVRGGTRAVHGGYYLPAYQLDIKANRYGCFGIAATARLCGLGSPPLGGG